MRTTLPDRLEDGRLRVGRFGTDPSYGPYGCFTVHGPCGCALKIISSGSDGTGWEHVSVSTERRPPNWQEMCFAKDLFWSEEECVMQLHPPKSEYVNNHPHCLHLWRPVDVKIPMPPTILVGIKGLEVVK
jgi:hypothetical protein